MRELTESDFLREHLHDPHWREVILLLLGKMKSTPVTRQLRPLLQGKLRSLRSRYTEIFQQDLFFICTCLVDGIKVEEAFAREVVTALEQVVRSPRSLMQQREALDFLGRLMPLDQYNGQGKKELLHFALKDDVLDATGRLNALQALFLHSSILPELRAVASQTLMELARRPDFPVEQVSERVESLYRSSAKGPEIQKLLACLWS